MEKEDEDMNSHIGLSSPPRHPPPSNAGDILSLSLAEKQRRTAHALLTAYKIWSLSDATSLDRIFEHRTPDCVQVTLPRTAGVPDRNNAQYRAYLQSLVLADLAPWEGELEIEDPIISDPDARICVARVHGTARRADGGELHDRTVWFLHFPTDDEGEVGREREKVCRVEVWVDTRQVWVFKEKFREWTATQQRREREREEKKRRKQGLGKEEGAVGRKKSRSPRVRGQRERSVSGSSSGRGGSWKEGAGG